MQIQMGNSLRVVRWGSSYQEPEILYQPGQLDYPRLFSILELISPKLLFESKCLPAVLLLLRIYFPIISVTVTVLKFD